MPRGLFRKITPRHETVRTHWALKPFSRFFGDPRLWSLQRRTVTPAFGAGLAICFVPLPIHIPIAAMTAIFCRIHIPTIMLTLILSNPLTWGPMYYLAYKVGVIVMRVPPIAMKFEMSWDWVQHGLGPMCGAPAGSRSSTRSRVWVPSSGSRVPACVHSRGAIASGRCVLISSRHCIGP